MNNFICLRCGVQYAASVRPPARCDICEDEREAVYWEGQRWTTLADLRRGHHNVVQPLEPDLTGIHTEPHFAIGQQSLLVHYFSDVVGGFAAGGAWLSAVITGWEAIRRRDMAIRRRRTSVP